MTNDNTQSVELLELIFQNTHTLIAYLDKDMKFLRVNSAYSNADGKEPGYFIGKGHFDLFPNEENEIIFNRVVETGESHFSFAKPFEYEQNPERGVTHWDWSLVPVKDKQGEVTSLILHLIDVTERIEAEEKLKLEEQLNSAFIDSSQALMTVLDSKGRIVRFNRACERTTQYQSNEIIGKKVWDVLLLPEEKESVSNVFHNLNENALPNEYENYWITKDGSKLFIHWSNNVLKNESGAVQYIISVGIDVTEARKTEEALKLSEKRLKLAVDGSNDGMWEWNIVTGEDYFSSRWLDILGYEHGELPCHVDTFIDLINDDDKPNVQREMEQHLKNNTAFNIEMRMRHKSGDDVWVFSRGQAVRNEQGEPITMSGFITDITERKKVEREIENIFELSIDMIGAGNLQGYFHKINSSFKRVLGYEDEEFMAKPFIDYVYEEDLDETLAILQEAANGKEDLYLVNRYKCKDGSLKWIEWNVIANAKENAFYATGSDITERKKDEVEIGRYRNHLEELVEQRTDELNEAQGELLRKERLATLGQLTATVSHELRNPLGAIRPSLYVLQKKSDPNDQRLQQAIERIDRNIDRCDNIIDELLDFTRITELNLRPVRVDEWLNSVIDEQIIPEGLHIEKDFSLKELELNVDTDRLRRAVINVFENGCHAMMDGNQQIVKDKDAHIKIKTTSNKNRVEMSITDTGSGISEDVLRKIFEPLFSTKGFGVGLGMPTVKQIMEQHGGGINIESEEGKGATITLWLPVKLTEDDKK